MERVCLRTNPVRNSEKQHEGKWLHPELYIEYVHVFCETHYMTSLFYKLQLVLISQTRSRQTEI